MSHLRATVRATVAGLAACVACAVGSSPAHALIKVQLPLQQLISGSDFIGVARVERLDPERPAAVLAITQELKGRAPAERMPVNLRGTPVQVDGKEVLHTADLLKRLAPELPIVLFAQKQGDRNTMVLAYTNGTWFQVIGQNDGGRQTWAFTHCEIYLRRTFHGATTEMQQVVADVLARRARAPRPDAAVAPGLGPEVAEVDGSHGD